MIWENILNSNQRRARQSTSNDDEKTKNAWKYQYYSQLTQLISNASAPNSQEIILGVSTMMHVFFFLRYVSVGRATMHCVRNDACRVSLAVTSSTATAMAKWEVEKGEIQQQQNRSRSSIFVISSDILIRIKLIENENYGLSRVEHITTATDCNTQHYEEVKKKIQNKTWYKINKIWNVQFHYALPFCVGCWDRRDTSFIPFNCVSVYLFSPLSCCRAYFK